MSIQFDKVKLVIWDLDETFWQGILSEGRIRLVERNMETVKKLTDAGIINAICSKNDPDKALSELRKAGVADLFVFPSVDWTPKGPRIQALLSDMGLRAENTLFLDDEDLNRQEAVYYNPGLMTGGIGELDSLAKYAEQLSPDDKEHTRLGQYRILEAKRDEKRTSASNEEFLRKSNIRVEMKTDCMNHLERIHELVMRTNQLNFTKIRCSMDELRTMLEKPEYWCGYVSVKDKYGDYGMIGFYAGEGQKLIHFLFSCRTIGMGVEQYVYAKLGYPEYTRSGETAGELSKTGCPDWINQENCDVEEEKREQIDYKGVKHKILFKGPCDLDAIFSFIEPNDGIDCEFTYVSPQSGVVIEQVNHTIHMLEADTLSKEQKQRIIEELPFGDADMYSDLMYRHPYDIIFISILQDVNLGIYRRKETGELVAFAQGYYPLTDPANWEAYIEGRIYTAQCKLTREFLEAFSDKYEFAGILTPEQTVENIEKIREYLNPKTHLVIMLGTETEYLKNKNPAWSGKNLVYKEINERIREMCKDRINMDYIDINRYIRGQESFYDHYNHFVVSVYYEMSKDIVNLIREKTGGAVENKSAAYAWKRRVKELIKKILKKI